jgi:hypothetical protein
MPGDESCRRSRRLQTGLSNHVLEPLPLHRVSPAARRCTTRHTRHRKKSAARHQLEGQLLGVLRLRQHEAVMANDATVQSDNHHQQRMTAHNISYLVQGGDGCPDRVERVAVAVHLCKN